MNIKDLSDTEIKALLYDCVLEKERVEHNMRMLKEELIRRGESPTEDSEEKKEG